MEKYPSQIQITSENRNWILKNVPEYLNIIKSSFVYHGLKAVVCFRTHRSPMDFECRQESEPVKILEVWMLKMLTPH